MIYMIEYNFSCCIFHLKKISSLQFSSPFQITSPNSNLSLLLPFFLSHHHLSLFASVFHLLNIAEIQRLSLKDVVISDG